MRLRRRVLNPAFAAGTWSQGAEHGDVRGASRRSLNGRVPVPSALSRAEHESASSVFGRIVLRVGRWCGDSAACVAEWRRRARSRGELMLLGERDLSDMHLTRCDASYEASKPFWKQ